MITPTLPFLLLGGGSSCGKFAIQIAKLAGIGKIVSVGGSEQELKVFGATDVIDRHGDMILCWRESEGWLVMIWCMRLMP